MVVLEESILRDHHAVAQATEVGPVFHFLGKDIAGVDNARDVKHGCSVVLVTLADVVFAEIEVLNAFGGAGS